VLSKKVRAVVLIGVAFYQILSYTDDVDLNQKLAAWERFYNFDRPHGAHGGKTPHEALRTMLDSEKSVSVA